MGRPPLGGAGWEGGGVADAGAVAEDKDEQEGGAAGAERAPVRAAGPAPMAILIS